MNKTIYAGIVVLPNEHGSFMSIKRALRRVGGGGRKRGMDTPSARWPIFLPPPLLAVSVDHNKSRGGSNHVARCR